MELNINSPKIVLLLTVLIVGVFAVNFVLYSNVNTMLQKQSADLSYLKGSLGSGLTGLATTSVALVAEQQAQQAQQERAAVMATLAQQVLPKGVPAIYGDELNVSFSDAVKSLEILAKFDDGIDHTQFSQADLDTYITIGTSISCEYCCGAKAMVFTKEQTDAINEQYANAGRSERLSPGDRACGCQHSYAMRGLAKYLITNHRSEFTDGQILEEVAKWKAVFFPGPTVEKIAAQQGLVPTDGATASTGTSSSSVPSQVGGC